MTFTIRLNNPGGELASKTATTEREAARVAIELIQEAGQLDDGDTITVTDNDAPTYATEG